MKEKIGKNCVYPGSFNPLHIGHILAVNHILEQFEYAHVFVRYSEGTDLTDWETKAGWFEELGRQRQGRVLYYKEPFDASGKDYGLDLFFDFMANVDKRVGEQVDGFCFGMDYESLLPRFQERFPDKKFLMEDRSAGYSSTAIREDPGGHKMWLPDHVYTSLKGILY